MAKSLADRKWLWASGLGAVALVAAFAGSGASEETILPTTGQTLLAGSSEAPDGGGMQDRLPAMADGRYQNVQYDPQDSGAEGQGGAEQALEGLAQIRQQQCQMGNQLACQALPTIPGIRRQLAEAARTCRSGDCGAYDSLARRIFTAYSESAAVMRAGEQGMAQMDAWRAQMNRNAAESMANLRAQGARGQAAHEARQESYAAMNRNWQSTQDSIDRRHGSTIDRIYEGTTMNGGGVQARVDDGYLGYTDGNGNVISVPEGEQPPAGWQPMTPTYAPPR